MSFKQQNSRSLPLLCLALLINPTFGGFDHVQCFNDVQNMLSNHTIDANDTTIFATNSSGKLLGNSSLTIPGCVQLCGGPGTGWYSDAPSRLLTWFLPAIFLLNSMQYAPLGKKKLFMIVHLFGDPIHSIWSLQLKLDDWNTCYSEAEMTCGGPDQSQQNHSYFRKKITTLRQLLIPLLAIKKTEHQQVVTNAAVVWSAIQEVQRSLSDDSSSEESYGPCKCIKRIKRIAYGDRKYHSIAAEIVDRRTSGTDQAWLAIALYILGIIANFVNKLGGNSSPSGGKIAPPMFLSWLLPTMLLSNIVGQFNSRDCIRSIIRLDEETKGQHEDDCPGVLGQNFISSLKVDDWKPYLDSLVWSGGIYTCEIIRPMLARTARQKATILRAVLPVLISFTIACRVLDSAPTYTTCRHFMLLAMFVAWLVSSFLTRCIMERTLFGKTKKSRWVKVMVKDGIIGFGTFLLLVLSSVGLGNTCRCWAGFLHSNIAVQLDSAQQFSNNDRYIYPLIVTGCLCAQYVVFKWTLYEGMHGLSVMRWTVRGIVAALPTTRDPIPEVDK
jgi:hypothetical protein